MRAPLCAESSGFNSEEQDFDVPATDCKTKEIHALKKSLEKKQSSKREAFGICLDILMGSSCHVDPHVPFVLSRLCEFIESHGLCQKNLFVEGGEKNIVESLKVEFIQLGDAPLEATGNVFSAARLLIIFFEELPEPLIPIDMQSTFLKDMENLSLMDSFDLVQHLKKAITCLPNYTYIVLKFLSCFLKKVFQHQEHNGMSSDDLGHIFGPLIFRTHKRDLVSVECVTSNFVKNYDAIFENGSILYPENDVAANKKSHNVSTEVKSRAQIPCPSSVMSLMPLEPLSVVIPSVNSNFESEEKSDELRKNIPMLLIESQMDKVTERNNKTNHKYIEDFSASKDKNNSLVTRKRKERRLSGEDSQAQRSSSEERPSPTAPTVQVQNELMRRCSSHEEMNENFKSNGNLEEMEEISQPVSPYFNTSLELVSQDKDHSPHPPNAKRREVESCDSNKVDMNSQDNSLASAPDHNWKSSTGTEHSHNNSAPEKSLNLDVKCQYVYDQDSIAEFEMESIMDCSAAKDSNTSDPESSPATSSGVDFYDNMKARFPRSASCPLSRTENEKNSDSDTNSLSLSWSMLFESEDSEPVRSEHRFHWPNSRDDDTLLSPSVQSLRKSSFYEAPLSPSAYRSYLSYRHTHLDPNVPPSPPVEQEDFAKSVDAGSSVSDSIKQHTKKIHGLKKKIRRFDEKFESEFGYKPSHAEKTNHPESRKFMSELHKARKELKALKEESHLEHAVPSTSWQSHRESHILGDSTNCIHNDAHKLKPSVEDSLEETLKSLADERRTCKRPESVEDMSKDQIKEEKHAIQKALLNFESIHGKPCSKGERNTIRPLYDRYRCVKRLLVRSGTFPGTGAKNKDSCTELQPILEHEAMNFTSPQQRTDEENSDKSELQVDSSQEKNEEPEVSIDEKYVEESDTTPSFQFLTSKYNNSNIHELPLSEMVFQLQQSKSEKRRLRKILKEFETEFQKLNGRKVQKDDKAPVEALYAEYKHVKARLKLLEALVSKKDQHQLM